MDSVAVNDLYAVASYRPGGERPNFVSVPVLVFGPEMPFIDISFA